MIAHVAIFNWKDGVTEEEIASVMQEIRALKKKVPGVTDILCGKNFSQWNEGYTHAFVVLARDHEAITAYRAHPDHARVAAHIDVMDGGSIGIDIEDA